MSRFALISVSDKTGVVEFVRALVDMGFSILSTGGTASLLTDSGISVTEVADYTGFPEILDGRVKTLHPKVHGGILARRDRDGHIDLIREHDISAIDVVVVNLYPFRQSVAAPGSTLEDAIENIDIGGTAMLRSAAKNYRDVAVICDPADYVHVIEEMASHGGGLSETSRFRLAEKTFFHTAKYDSAIAEYLFSHGKSAQPAELTPYPQTLCLLFEKVQEMRYGENPHQSAAFYRESTAPGGAFADYTQLQGKELSYNNISDADAAWECVKAFDEPACVILKHANPCGVAIGSDLLEAYSQALRTDPEAAFGGIIAFNRELDGVTAEKVAALFVEVVIAPAFSGEARAVFASRKNVRLLEIPFGVHFNEYEIKRVGGGVLLQSPDVVSIGFPDLQFVTRNEPAARQVDDMLFAWRVVKFVKSNAIVFCRDGMTLAIGAGQMSRVDAARNAVMKAKNAGISLEGSAVASDAFFPFRDGLDMVVDAGATSIIQPGGSIRDQEVIDAADERGIAMAFTSIRHFRH